MPQTPSHFNLPSLIRSDVAEMETYTPIFPLEALSGQLDVPIEKIIKLDANENPYGPSPKVGEALASYPFLHIYPDPESRDLRKALNDYTGLPARYLMAGHGADELIDMIMRLFITPGDAIINCPPTFGMYSFDAGINGARIISVERGENFSLNIPAIEAAAHTPRAKLLFITSPNNPDGSLISAADIKRLLKLPIVVILDEAYAEFSGRSYIEWAATYSNLIVLRTFSKWAALAGLRVGYGAFPPAIMEHLWKIKQPYNVSVAGQLAALASLQDTVWLKHNVEKIIATRQAFQRQLAQILWLRPYPSNSNFVLARVLGRSAAGVKQTLARRGILLRHYTSARLDDHLRFSIGTPQQMNKLVEELQLL